MKYRTIIALLAVFGAPLLEASQPQAERAAPKPRLRLYLYLPNETPAVMAESAQGDPGVVTMERIEVTESRVPAVPDRIEPKQVKRFTPTEGGRIFSGRLGKLPVDVGFWPTENILAADSRFKPQPTRVDLDLIRIRF